jgi:hypothetical protein
LLKKDIPMKSLCFLILLFSVHANSEILFEGYYKVTQAKKHIGFIIQRNEIDSKTKYFKTTSFLKLSKNGFDMSESLQAISDADLKPISYTYLSTDGTKSKTIDATFNFKTKEPKMTALITENGEKKKKDKKITNDTFLSSALYYFMLKSKTGIKVDTKYDFSAIAEETFDVSKGSARIEKKLITQGPLQLMQSQNNFSGSEYSNLLNERGEVISANTPATGIELVLVQNSEEATEGVKVNSGTLEKIFGDVPKGKVNIYGR